MQNKCDNVERTGNTVSSLTEGEPRTSIIKQNYMQLCLPCNEQWYKLQLGCLNWFHSSANYNIVT